MTTSPFCFKIGTAFMYHSSLVSTVRELFMLTYAACVLKYAPKPSLRWVCGIDQGHFTRMKAASPGLFRNTGVGESDAAA